MKKESGKKKIESEKANEPSSNKKQKAINKKIETNSNITIKKNTIRLLNQLV